MDNLLIFVLGVLIGLLAHWFWVYYNEEVRVLKYDQEEVYENCTVRICTSSKHDKTDVGWWKGGRDDLPVIHTPYEDGEAR